MYSGGVDMELSVAEVAKKYGVTTMAVRHWMKKGLPFSTKKIIGRKPFKVIKESDLDSFLNLSEDK